MRTAAGLLVIVLTLLAPIVQEVTAQDFSAVVAKSRSSVVLVFVEQNDGSVGSGTGFAISGSPVLVTAAHVVRDVKELAVRYEDGTPTDRAGTLLHPITSAFNRLQRVCYWTLCRPNPVACR